MAPNTTASACSPNETDVATQLQGNVVVSKNEKYAYESQLISQLKNFKWFNITVITFLHVMFLKEMFTFPYRQNLDLVILNVLHGVAGATGVTAGAHRLWTHRCYKARVPLRIIWMLCHTAAGMGPIYDWVRDHRLHHKYLDTHADPYNAKRGFFFSHVGWLFIKKRPEVIEKGKQIDMSDVSGDPVIQFHQKYYIPMLLLLGFVLPTVIPPLLWGQSWYLSFLVTCVGRYVFILNLIWSINSVSHYFGFKPYDKNITATDFYYATYLTLGEGWHNFHHTFPWSYKFGRFAGVYADFPAYCIEGFAKIGWAYDLKAPSSELIKRAALRAGDGSHPLWGNHMEIPESAELQFIDKKDVNNNKNNKIE